MDTEDLISKLSNKVSPVKPVASVVRRCLQWLAIVAVCFGASVVLLGLSFRMHGAMIDLWFWLEALLLLVLGLVSASSALILSVPGRRLAPWLQRTAHGVAALWLLLGVGATITLLIDMSPERVAHLLSWRGAHCTSSLFLLSLMPAAALVLLVRQAAPVRLGRVGFWVGLASAALAAFALQFMCPVRSPVHLLVWHMLPAFLLGWLGVALGRWLLRW